MEAPNYLDSLDHVAKRFGSITDHERLYARLKETWDALERTAIEWQHDILHDAYPNHSIQNMATVLYETPRADKAADCEIIRQKDKEYGGSWYRRGGRGAFFMLARKWDRIEEAVKKHGTQIFATDERAEGILDDFGDLRRYLLLVLAWHEARELQRSPF